MRTPSWTDGARGLALVTVLAGIILPALPAAAQSTPATRRLEIDVGLRWTAAEALGSRDASLETPGGGTLTLFSTTNDLTGSLGPEVHVAFPFTRRFRAEATGSWSHADVRSRVSGDFEDGGALTSTLGVSIFTAEGSAMWLLPRRGRLEPFVRGGAGWLRELTSGDVLSGDGLIISAGGGVKYWWREWDRGALKRFGFRSELRLVSRSSGLPLAGKPRPLAPAVTAGAILGF